MSYTGIPGPTGPTPSISRTLGGVEIFVPPSDGRNVLALRRRFLYIQDAADWLEMHLPGEADGCGNQCWTWSRLSDVDIEYSTDRKTWHKCEVADAPLD